jgi:hypothetical protein
MGGIAARNWLQRSSFSSTDGRGKVIFLCPQILAAGFITNWRHVIVIEIPNQPLDEAKPVFIWLHAQLVSASCSVSRTCWAAF